MKFFRLATVSLGSDRALDAAWRWKTNSDGAAVQTQRIELSDGSRCILVMAEVDFISQPRINDSGRIEVDSEVRHAAEQAIELFADLAAVATRTSRSISSPQPAAGLTDLNDSDRKWLETVVGIEGDAPVRSNLIYQIDLGHPSLTMLASDRRDGVLLLAEALSNGHPTGRFTGLIRVFERAFALRPGHLVDPLTRFLAGHPSLQYSSEEVVAWLNTVRSTAVHARLPKFATAVDVQPVLERVEQAAYDVLFNKDEWATRSPGRRESWTLPGGVLRNGTLVMRQGTTPAILGQMMDEFGAYPLHLKCKINPIPPAWWIGTPLDHRL